MFTTRSALTACVLINQHLVAQAHAMQESLHPTSAEGRGSSPLNVTALRHSTSVNSHDVLAESCHVCG